MLKKHLFSIICIWLLPISLFAENDTSSLVEEVKEEASIVTFSDIVPSQSIYPFWDTTKVDPYNINVKDSLSPTFLDFVSDDCHFNMPITGEITSKFGWRRGRMHKGIDLDLNTGDTVAVVFDGLVRISEYSPSFGYFIVVRHYNGLETLYAHLARLEVKVGESVVSGQMIGLGGNTGRSRGSHLHFEVRFLGKSMNPETIFDFENGALKMESYLVTREDFKHVYTKPKYSSSGARKYHTIKSGDTLGHIARKYHTRVSTLCKLNGIRSTTTLRIGRRLRVR